MYQWLLGALRALRAARPGPPPSPPSPTAPTAKRPPSSIPSPGEDPDEVPAKKQKTECLVCGTDKRLKEVSVATQLPPKATSGCQEASGGDATSVPEPGEGAQSTSSASSLKRATDCVAHEDRVEVAKMPCDTDTCLTRSSLTLSLPHKGVPYLSLKRNNHHIQPAPDSPVTPRPPIKELPVPHPTSPGVNSPGRPLCAAEEDVRRGESQRYKEILKMFKAKYSGRLSSPQPASSNTVQTHSKEPVVTGNHLKGQKSWDVYPCVTQRTRVKRGDALSPQLPQRGVMIGYYTPPEDSHGQGIPGKQTVAVGQREAEVSQGMLFQFHVKPVLSKDLFFVDREPSPRSEKPAEDFAPLTEAMEKEVSAALGKGEPGEILSSAFKLKVTREDICTLHHLRWLNDETFLSLVQVINFYMNLLVERSKREGYPALHAFSTFFYPKLCSGGYKAVRRWTRGVDLFKQDLILVPIHLRVHWTLLVIDVRKKTIKYFDSLGQKGDDICTTLLQYLQEESKEKRKLELAASEWTLRSMSPREIPQQTNGSDCGVFVCKYADSISRDKPITFTQEHMPYFRRKMVWEIIHQQLL